MHTKETCEPLCYTTCHKRHQGTPQNQISQVESEQLNITVIKILTAVFRVCSVMDDGYLAQILSLSPVCKRLAAHLHQKEGTGPLIPEGLLSAGFS